MLSSLCTDPVGAGAALFIGLFGSAHCLVMCGGITAAFSLNLPEEHRQGWPFWQRLGAASLGRITTYLLLGVAFGALGGWLSTTHSLMTLVLRLIAGVVLILMGLWVSQLWRGVAWLESAGYRLVAPWIHRAHSKLRPTTVGRAFRYGLTWGLLPCGLVYSALLWSASTAHAGQAGIQMALFGLGTLPALLGAGYLASHLVLQIKSANLHRISGLLLILYGLWTLTPVVAMSWV